jgi:RNA polymerase sigma factor (sigma-70 family)
VALGRTRELTGAEADADAVTTLEPVVRRVVRARVRDPGVVDELVQETLARVWERRRRLDDDALLPYAVATARNLVISRARTEDRRAGRAHRLVDVRAPERPEDSILRGEEERSVAEALERLGERERDALVAHEVEGRSTAELAQRRGSSAGAAAVHLAGARAKLRVEYLLALRRVQLPTSRCRPVLLSLSAGDRRSQQALDAGGHLLACETCAELSSPLLERKRALAVVLPLPLGKALWTVFREAVREHPVASASAGGAVVVAGVAGGVLVARDDPAPPPSPPPPSVAAPAPAPAPPVPSSVVVDGEVVPPVEPGDTLLPYVGRPVEVSGAQVESVPADEGFWIGDGPDRRLWVQVTEVGESPATLRPGQSVSFLGTVVATPAGFARVAGVDAAEGAGQLQQQGAHLEVRVADLRVD